MAWPRIVAESLRGLQRAPLVGHRMIEEGSAREVVHAIALACRPERASGVPPRFLRPGQVDPWRRVMAALERWHGALLAEPVGSGKTWIALAVAAQERGPVVALVPAIVRMQWEAAALRAGVRLCCWTHERASRGQLPPVHPSLVIIDEAHRFREPSTRRVQTVAPWLVGRRTLLLTATPVVNRIEELVALLQLALPDDALRLDGLASLRHLTDFRQAPPALRRIAIRSPAPTSPATTRRLTIWQPPDNEIRRAASAVAAVGTLVLSTTPGVQRLLTAVLLDAAASSEAAFRASLGRYRALLLQARDAGGADRALLRRFAGDSLDQLVMWEVIGGGDQVTDLPLDDIARVESLLATRAERDAWLHPLLHHCADGRTTICFARHRATATAVRETAGEQTAWITGSSAGIGPHRLPRELVLAAFGPGRNEWRARRTPPTLLVTTDVAAEGLDLQAAGRIVHLDLPWTATRVEQREGRLLRIGQAHAEVEVLVRPPAAPIEAALRLARQVQRKRTLSERWLHALEAADPVAASGSHECHTIITMAEIDREIVAVELRQGDDRGVVILSRANDEPWQHDRGDLAAPASPRFDHDPVPAWADRHATLDSASRAAIALVTTPAAPASAALIAKIHQRAHLAARQRNRPLLAHLDRLLRFAISAHTLGERLLLDQLAERDPAQWPAIVIPERRVSAAVVAHPVAALLFRSRVVALR